MAVKKYLPVKPKRKWFKEIVSKIIFFVLGRAFQAGSRFDKTIRADIELFDEGFILLLKVLPNGPRMALEKRGSRFKYIGSKITDGDLVINFKNIECAFLILTPQMGTAQAYAERRLSVKGDLMYGMTFNRCLSVLLCYLYPTFISKHLVKRVMPMTVKKIGTILLIYIGIALGI